MKAKDELVLIKCETVEKKTKNCRFLGLLRSRTEEVTTGDVCMVQLKIKQHSVRKREIKRGVMVFELGCSLFEREDVSQYFTTPFYAEFGNDTCVKAPTKTCCFVFGAILQNVMFLFIYLYYY